MKQTAVEWLMQTLEQNNIIDLDVIDSDKYYTIIEQAKEIEKQQERSYSEEEFKEMVYHMVGGLAQANNMTFNGAILDELFNKFKNK